MLEFRKDILDDSTRTASIKKDLARLANVLNEHCTTRAAENPSADLIAVR